MLLSPDYTRFRFATTTERVLGYQLWATENGKRYILIHFTKDPSEFSTDEIKKLFIKRIRDSWDGEPPWDTLGWRIEQLVISGGELETHVVSQVDFSEFERKEPDLAIEGV